MVDRTKRLSFWRRSLPSGVADRDVQIWVICTRPPAWSASRQTLGRADVTDVLARPFSSPPSTQQATSPKVGEERLHRSAR